MIGRFLTAPRDEREVGLYNFIHWGLGELARGYCRYLRRQQVG
jgi:hypothetical protein